MLANSYRELQELSRDPIRLTLAGLGSVILMIIIGYGVTLDVEHLKFAALDRDETTISREYLINIAGSSRYFVEGAPVADYHELDRRMRSGELSMVVEIPPGFGRAVEHWSEGKRPVQIGIWIDGAMPQRAETIRGYVQGMHLLWLDQVPRYRLGQPVTTTAKVELRYRYNPNVKSLMAIVPAVIPLLLLLIPAMLATLSVVREKDLGSIINFYVTPTTRLEFLLGKQLPYVALGFLNFLLLVLLALALFRVPMKGSFLTDAPGTLLYVTCSTGIGILVSTVTRTQVAALFATAIITLVPAANFCGLTDPVSSLSGFGRFVGNIYPTAHYITDLARHFLEGARFWRALSIVHSAADRHPGAIGLSAVF